MKGRRKRQGRWGFRTGSAFAMSFFRRLFVPSFRRLAPELMYWGNAANAEYYRVCETFITTGLIYLILTVTTGRLLARLERKRA